MTKDSVKLNQTQGQNLVALCTKCRQETNHTVLSSVDTEGYEIVDYIGNDPKEPITINWSNNYQVIQCQGCDEITFRHKNWFSEYEQFYGPNNGCDGTSIRLYPKRSLGSCQMIDLHNTPEKLSRIYRETIDSFNNECLMLCAAGLRTIVEGICANQNIKDGPIEISGKNGNAKIERKTNLQGKISGLNEKGVLTKEQSELLHEHRFLGNDAVHELSQPSIEELKLAIEIIEHIIKNIYEIPKKATDLRMKVQKRKAVK